MPCGTYGLKKINLAGIFETSFFKPFNQVLLNPMCFKSQHISNKTLFTEQIKIKKLFD